MPNKEDRNKKNTISSIESERYRLLVENIEDYAIFLLDVEGNVASWNEGAEKFKGYRADEIIGKHFSVFYGEEDQKNKKPVKELKDSRSRGSVEDEGWRIKKDGTKFWANAVITSLQDSAGKHVGFAMVTRDLTERIKFENRLFEATKKLEHSYEELQILSAAKDEFVSLASHQLRTPATGVKQYLSLLLGGYTGVISDLQRDYLQKAYESNDRQLDIVNDLLQVAQLDAGKVVLHLSETDVGELIENIIDEQVDKFKARRQKLNLHIPSDRVLVDVDRVRFRMVLENLIDNAIKYTPDRGVITVSVFRGEKTLAVHVQDNGIGIKKKDVNMLFNKFSRVSSPLTIDITGSGLGLYWALKIIELHRGKIEVDSKINQGTVFKVIVPLRNQIA